MQTRPLQLNSQTALNAVTGYPLSHSRSPQLHEIIYGFLNVNAVMLAFPNRDIAAVIRSVRALPVRLLAVTSPHKQAVIKYLDVIDPAAKKIGAVNTVVNRSGKLYGYNTDIIGIQSALAGIKLKGKNVLVLGAGGAARAVCWFLKKNGAKILCQNRTQQKAEKLMREFGGKAVGQKDLKEAKIDLIINATPVGMFPKIGRSPFPKKLLRPNQIVFDLVYNPPETRLIKEAKAVGAKTVSGLKMFVGQALGQVKLWKGKEPSASQKNELISIFAAVSSSPRHTVRRLPDDSNSPALLPYAPTHAAQRSVASAPSRRSQGEVPSPSGRGHSNKVAEQHCSAGRREQFPAPAAASQTNFKVIKRLPSIEAIIREFPLSAADRQKIARDRQEIKNILAGKDPRLLIITGPCSAWPYDAALEYAEKLRALEPELRDRLKIVMRVYTQKPRTSKGWTGPVNQPDPFAPADIGAGLKYARSLMVKIIKMGLPVADEAVFTANAAGFVELLSWVAIGARSTENQEHRIFASALDCAVGLKNPTGGSLQTGVNSVVAAQHGHTAVFDGAQAETRGNSFAHLVLRGGLDRPNYRVEDLFLAKKLLEAAKVRNPAIIIDASHDNAKIGGIKDPLRQINVINEVLAALKLHPDLRGTVKGFMLESFLKNGAQKIEKLTAKTVDRGGLSLTDPCLGWDRTAKLLKTIAAEHGKMMTTPDSLSRHKSTK
jgi:3-deoxy-7-phosphoheptulonate synthase